jgi:hypothetical protein
MENEFIFRLKHYRFELEAYLKGKKEEFIIYSKYSKFDMPESSIEKIEMEIERLNLIINSYERFKQYAK